MTLKEKRAVLEAEGYEFHSQPSVLFGRIVTVKLNGVMVCDKNFPSRPHVSKFIRHVFEHRPHRDWLGNDLRKAK